MGKGFCHVCKVSLTEENSTPSTIKKQWGYCRECDNLERRRRYKESPGKQKAASDRYRYSLSNAKKKDINSRTAAWARKKKFGISQETFDAKLSAQFGLCEICKEPLLGQTRTKVPCLDHDHKSKKIRDILCTNCNLILGNSFDNQEILAGAIRYLRKHSKDINMAMSNEEALGGVSKKKAAMANTQPGTTSHHEEALSQKAKKRAPMAHSQMGTTSHEDEALGGMSKKKPAMVGNGGNTSAGDASGAI